MKLPPTGTMLSTRSEVSRRALKDALGFPSLTLLASMTGFGSLARESGLTLGVSLGATAGVWGLPGQVALAEMHAAGVSALFVILAVSLANARFLPMAVSFIPLMRSGVRSFGWMFLLVQFMSINSWAAGLRTFPHIPVNMRQRYYIIFVAICMTSALIGTAIGFFSIAAMPRPLALGLIFLNPLFFAVLLAVSRSRPALLSLTVGAPLGPVFHMLSPDWGLLATGVIGGTLAFWVDQRLSEKVHRG